MPIRITVLLACLSLSACSGIELAFNHFDTAAAWQLDDMFDLTEQQDQQVRKIALTYRDWIRADYFPVAIKALEEAQVLWQQNQAAEATQILDNLIYDFRDRSLHVLWPELLPVIFTMNQTNTQHYLEYLSDSREEWFESSQSRENRIEHRIERLEDWVGELTDEQIALVKQRIFWQEGEYNLRVKNNQYGAERFIAAALKQDTSEFEQWKADPMYWTTPEYREWRNKNNEQVKELMGTLFNTLNRKQKEHVYERVSDWLRILKRLSEPRNDEAPSHRSAR